jgi:hypothetical protein
VNGDFGKGIRVEMWPLEINVSIFFTGILSLFTKLELSNLMGNTILKICRSEVHLCWFYIVKATYNIKPHKTNLTISSNIGVLD